MSPNELVEVKRKEIEEEVTRHGFFKLTCSHHINDGRTALIEHSTSKWEGILTVNTTGYSVEGDNFSWIGQHAKELLRYLDEVLTKHYRKQ